MINIKEITAPYGRIVGGTLLVAGCCIGAGMLGLPVMSAMAGFKPSLLMFFISWLFMTATGLLLLEVNLRFPPNANLISMVDHLLGKTGKVVAWGAFLFLFCSLMVAYIAGCGDLFVDIAQRATGVSLPLWMGNLLFSVLVAVALYCGTAAVDQCNRLLMIGLVVTYVALVIMGAPHVQLPLLEHRDWSAAYAVIPVMIISFGYHNLVPSLTTYLHRDVHALRLTIVLGTVIPLLIYLIWEALILGIVPVDGQNGFRSTLSEGQLATHALKSVTGIEYVIDMAQSFAFFALITSFLSVALGFVDFLVDGIRIQKKPLGRSAAIFLALVPAFFFALKNPDIFLTALNYAGGFGAVLLYGILPAVMVWRLRAHQKEEPLVPGGRVTLILLIAFSLMVICLQLFQR